MIKALSDKTVERRRPTVEIDQGADTCSPRRQKKDLYKLGIIHIFLPDPD
ncbi:hypothetical protein JAK58_11790 [Stenotrophomonas maltophilia]|nr:hypothetical protein [Stenotrophomonas maltophilia]MCU1092195.1 hypothetical protein [Stenotrophomonas maltophilia]HDS1558212.1 hypothetical protein [Stenotrophomonas maltophilia]HDS1650183.1 hypothetical protein [Stenotrophomonas maltophilia]HEL3864083.1 hypothetical protein [Stenotrophomonas maltophilia]HEL4287957.1 hypothetical protein [Stenotrophomonas maltophilia]